MKNYTNSIVNICLLIAALSTFVSCKKDDKDVASPVNPNETELVTTVKLIIKPVSNTAAEMYASYRDLDGDGGNAPIIDTIRLDANTEYHVQVLVLDETKNPVDTTSKEIEAEKDEHQFFYSKIGTYELTTNYLDFDDNNVPVGLSMNIQTGSAFVQKTNKLQVVLKHQPGLKPITGNGNASLGETDLEVNFPILVK
ncbi:hypothetical protein [Cytophaga hutchinsonii]|uniref:Type 1 periplasmic binding fold superfamily protein n=1 Tax=Cytophaga hutchinsonii (strain ATCC 33406 / DSM 1761 / CIP 103989 / NBRC 15051 / NCIMB 9469 / D465) TaxID=269798 RepID=A0A6N4SWY9_CYTH3|nr:hypothetical protein [Cytophaga hutchinsonii]ABG60943.1 hypothetical protein CHU_3710 [Cytophaga hutchinsonii ATCC 33406]SFX42912.1 hypothetical protein SAMN04487930_10457 [Cytophaga hutchinsonii ATCC 33406]